MRLEYGIEERIELRNKKHGEQKAKNVILAVLDMGVGCERVDAVRRVIRHVIHSEDDHASVGLSNCTR